MQLFSQLATRTITNKMADALSHREMSSVWPILTKLRCKLLRGCYTQATILATLRKVDCRSTFLATRNATIAVVKWGVTREFFLQLCIATFVALQVARKIASCDMAFSTVKLNSILSRAEMEVTQDGKVKGSPAPHFPRTNKKNQTKTKEKRREC